MQTDVTTDSASLFIRIARGGQRAVVPATNLGPTADGSLVIEILDCPPGTGADDVLDLMQGLVPPPGVVQLPYQRLVARRANGGCCGSCG